MRPNLSATTGRHKVPRKPPVWKRPFMVEMRSVPFFLVARSKYAMKDGWPNETFASVVDHLSGVVEYTPIVIPMTDSVYP